MAAPGRTVQKYRAAFLRRMSMNLATQKTLILTGHEDPMWPFLLEGTSQEERQGLFFFPTDSPRRARLTLDPVQGNALFIVDGQATHSSAIRSVWLRRLVPPDLGHLDREVQLYCEREHRSFLESLEYVLHDSFWVSYPSAIARARNKALQLRVAKSLGFTIPQTTFTSDPDHLRYQISEDVVYKSLVSPRVPVGEKVATVFTTRITREHETNADGLLSCPGIIQKFVDKIADIRVTIFGEQVFAVRVDSQENEYSRVDFRCGGRFATYSPYDLPKIVGEQCRNLVHRLGLEFGAIDLALMEDESYTFFEINPNGQWGWLEELTGLPMRRALLSLLTSGGRA